MPSSGRICWEYVAVYGCVGALRRRCRHGCRQRCQQTFRLIGVEQARAATNRGVSRARFAGVGFPACDKLMRI
jgi:hypothetical protein